MRRFVTAWFTAVVVLVGGAGLLAPTATAAPLAPTATAASLRDDPGTAAARAALVRLAPHLQQRFVLHHSVAAGAAGGAFTISRERGHVALSGSSNVALVSAFSWYLENVAHGQIARGPDNIPTHAPLPQATIHKTSPFQYRYLNNFTVGGYTTPNWDWAQWQDEIDLMAAHGVNTALVTVGQEAVWYDTFQDFGYGENEVRNWIVAPAHQPWQWMGNMEASGPVVSRSLLERRAELGRKVIDRMRQLGITPVVPGYSGIVPPGFAARNPGAHVVAQGDWDGTRRPDWLDTSSPTYQQVAASFYRHQQQRFGTLHAKAVDLLHEGGMTGGVPLVDAARGVDRALAAADPDYLWVIQAWIDNPREEIVNAVDKDHMLVLDLEHAQWQPKQAFWGTPWAWGELGNFGGRLGLFGHLQQIAHDLPAALASSDRGRLVGLAMMKEGTEQDPIVEQLMSRMVWDQSEVDLNDWARSYVTARYGTADPDALAAWRTLVPTAYSVNDERRADSVLNAQPDLSANAASPRQPRQLPYDPALIEQAWHRLLDASGRLGRLDTFQYDLVDVTRQVIVNRGRVVLPTVKAAYIAGDTAAFERTSKQFLHLMDLEESVLGTRAEFLFGPWLADARSWGQTAAEKQALARDAAALLTIWGEPRTLSQSNHEYANRDWSGLVAGYYKPRWKTYFATLSTALSTGQDPVPVDWYEVGRAFVDHIGDYPVRPSGDPVQAARAAAAQLRP